MIERTGESRVPASPEVLRILTRVARHEVGDLLQTVYATVALLQERLPPDMTLEKRLLSDVRWRAETCRNELDAIHDLICPMSVSIAPVDLGEVATHLAATFSRRYAEIHFRTEPVPIVVLADGRRISQAAYLLLIAACQSANREVRLQPILDTAERLGALEIWDDGAGVPEEQLRWQKSPFVTTRNALGGLGLALAEHIARLQDGRVEACNVPEGGFRVRLYAPLAPSGQG
jgi:signal transduction histidine kinase